MVSKKKGLFLLLGFLLAFASLVQAQSITIFSDNFSDGSFSPPWVSVGGTWSAATTELVGAASAGGRIFAPVDTNSVITANKDVMFSYQQRRIDVSTAGYLKWFTRGTAADANGYELVFSDSNATFLRKFVNGAATTLLSFSNHVVGQNYDINILRRSNGAILVYFNGDLNGSVIDNTFTDGNQILAVTAVGPGNHAWDDFLITATDLTKFYTVDENTNLLLDTTLLINGSPWPQNPDLSYDFNSGVTFPAVFTVSASNYLTRSFLFDSNQGLQEVKNLGLRIGSQAENMGFKFYSTDETTVLTNRFIKVIKNGILSGRGETDSMGRISFGLAPQDGNYDFNIMAAGTETGFANIEFIYDPVTLTLVHPKDEETNITIAQNYDYSVGGLGLGGESNVSGNKTIIILPNTTQTYDFRVDDTNSQLSDEYFPRTYAISLKGNPLTYTLDTFLVSANTGIPVNFTIKDKFTFKTLPGLLISSRRGIGGFTEVMEQQTTNSAGIVQFTFLSGTTYNISIEDLNTGIQYLIPNDGAYQAVTTQGFIISIPFTLSDQNLTSYDLNVSYLPHLDFLTGTTQKIDVNASTNYANFIQIQVLDGNRIMGSSTTTNPSLVFSNTFTLADFNGFLTFRIRVEGFGVIKEYTRTYPILLEEPGLIGAINGFKSQSGIVTSLLFTVFGLLLVLQAFGPNFSGNNESQLFLVLVVLAIFGIMFFYNPNLGPNEPDYMVPFYAAALFGIIAFWFFKRSG